MTKPTLTSCDMIDGPEWMQDECAQGYRDGIREKDVFPGANRSPSYIHGFSCAWRDKRRMPSVPMRQIVATWNLIVMSESAE